MSLSCGKEQKSFTLKRKQFTLFHSCKECNTIPFFRLSVVFARLMSKSWQVLVSTWYFEDPLTFTLFCFPQGCADCLYFLILSNSMGRRNGWQFTETRALSLFPHAARSIPSFSLHQVPQMTLVFATPNCVHDVKCRARSTLRKKFKVQSKQLKSKEWSNPLIILWPDGKPDRLPQRFVAKQTKACNSLQPL